MNALTNSTTTALQGRARTGASLFDPSRRLPSYAPDFFSNDYLSLSSFSHMRQELLDKLHESPSLFGSQGSRALNGTTDNHIGLERYFRDLYEAPAAMIFNSGYIANLSFLGGVPQPGDIYVHDELVHASCHDGMQMSRARNAMFSFSHNCPTSFETCILRVLEDHPQISAGTSTMFIVLESTYSMDGDFCPLQEFVALVEKHVPPSAAHIVVDEAHSLGLCGPRGMGLVKHLGLENRVHTVIHPLTKAPNFIGGKKSFVITNIHSLNAGSSLHSDVSSVVSIYGKLLEAISFQHIPSSYRSHRYQILL
jgi:8-amino-7-oxononanoate synthase